jgi:hypothetical protein
MTGIDNEKINAAALEVIGSELPTTQSVFERLNELDPQQSSRIDGIAKNLAARGMDAIAAEQIAVGVGLGILIMHEYAEDLS